MSNPRDWCVEEDVQLEMMSLKNKAQISLNVQFMPAVITNASIITQDTLRVQIDVDLYDINTVPHEMRRATAIRAAYEYMQYFGSAATKRRANLLSRWQESIASIMHGRTLDQSGQIINPLNTATSVAAANPPSLQQYNRMSQLDRV